MKHLRTRALRTAMTAAFFAIAGSVVATSAAAATVEFKLNPSLKGRGAKAAMEHVRTMGSVSGVADRLGVYAINAATESDAKRLASTLRESSTILWAEPKWTAPESNGSDVNANAYHARMVALDLRDGSDAAAVVSRLASASGQTLKLRRVATGNRALVVLPEATTSASMAALMVTAERDASVSKASRVQMARHQWIPNDALWSQQWALGDGVGGIRASFAWDQTPSGSVQVAVIDTGVRAHPDLDGKRVAGYDMISNEFIAADGDGRDSDESDAGDFECPLDNPFGDVSSSWHGTHVAGIIAASANNADGIAGVAPNARLQSIRALGRCGGTFEDISDSIRWAAGVPVPGVPNNPLPSKVINMSLGANSPGACPTDMQAAIDAAVARGVIVVAAAGNEADIANYAPANCKGVVSVAASNLLGDLSSYSNFGGGVTISAPGGDFGNLPGVLSTLNGNATVPGQPSYAVYSGTSMAAPHVAGVVALMLARDPNLTPGQVVNRLQGSVKAFPAGSECAASTGACGTGLLDAANAVASVAINRGINEVAANATRVHLVELINPANGRYMLSADPVEISRYVANGWSRTGVIFPTYSYTAAYADRTSIVQPVCRATLFGGAYVYSANTTECKTYLNTPGTYAGHGFVFSGALPTGNLCPAGSFAVWDLVKQDVLGYNVRNVADATLISQMLANGWQYSRVAFCAPN
ncbi:MAG: S8 family peptidase [Casimicrobium sp.]